MDKLSRLQSDDRENLIAYLDGELDEEATRRIESVLVESSVARNDIEALSRTYDLLDELPRPDVPADFVERTIATAKLEEVKIPLTSQPWFRTAKKIAVLSGWTAVMILVSILGTWGSRLASRDADDLLIEKLPVVRDLNIYKDVGSFEFLDQLSAEQSLLEEMKKEAGNE